MELLSGESLAELLERSGRLEPAQAAAIAWPLLDALAAAHDRGVVHRDLKPDNVFITRQGRVVVLDFGIAKLLPEMGDRMSPTTRTGALLGTPGYMAPEQIQGKPAVPATDLYSVGVILYQALCGRLPFEGDSLFELMQKHVSAAPPSLRQMRPEIAPAVEAVILCALAKDASRRFANARQMAESLAAALSGAPVEGAAPIESEGSGRGRMVAALAVGALLAAGFVLLAIARSDDETAEPALAVDAAALALAEAPPDASTQVVEAAAPPAADAAPPEKVAGPAKPRPVRSRSRSASAAPSGSPSSSSPETAGVTHIGGVTIINTAEKARAMTGLETITERPESSGGTFDPIRTLAQAEDLARKLMPDAVLVAIDVENARPDGRALLRADSGAYYRFRSPSRSARPRDVPRNVEVDIPCMVHVTVVRDRIDASPVTDEDCDAKRLARPRCRIADLWRRAREQGAPAAGDWVAKISYLPDGWFIDIPKAGKPPFDDFTLSLPDDCK
jgi:hypothetical protein